MRLAELIYNDKRLLRIARHITIDELKKDQVEMFLWHVQRQGIPWTNIGARHIYLALRELEMVFFYDPERGNIK